MGQGIDAAAQENPELAQLLDNMKDQLIIALVNRLGGGITVPVSEIDDTGQFILKMAVEPQGRAFKFKVSKKN